MDSIKSLLMVLGPTEIEPEILQAGSLPMEYMRTSDFSERLKNIFVNLQYVFQTENPVLIYASSGTGVMEAAVANYCKKGDSALYINGGTFGNRWGQICRLYGIDATELRVPFGNSVDLADVEKRLKANPNIKTVFATYDETSSGALTDIEMLGDVVYRNSNSLLIVDCVSALVVEPLLMDKWHIDVAISSSQKALAIPPGLGFMAVSPKAIQAAEANDFRTFYFDVLDSLGNYKRNQTPFTPPVGLLLQLEKRLEKIRNAGLESVRRQYYELTDYLRMQMNDIGFSIFAKKPANCVSGFYQEKFDALKLVAILREKYHIEIAPSGGDLKNRFFRVGNFGSITKEDIDYFIQSFKETLDYL